MPIIERFVELPVALRQVGESLKLPQIPTGKTRSQLALLVHYLTVSKDLLKDLLKSIRRPDRHDPDDVKEMTEHRQSIEFLVRTCESLLDSTQEMLKSVGTNPALTAFYSNRYQSWLEFNKENFTVLQFPFQAAYARSVEKAIYMINNDSLDQEAIERILSAFNTNNTLPTEVSVDSHPVRTFADGKLFYYLIFERQTPIAFIKTQELRLTGGKRTYQSIQAGVLSSRFGKGLVLQSYQGLLRDRILVSNDTQNAAGHNIFRRLWDTGLVDLYLMSSRNKIVAEVVLPEGQTQFIATTPGIRVYNSWSCLVACAKSNKMDNSWLKDQLPKTPGEALERNEKPAE